MYDYVKAATVAGGTLPDIDGCYEKKMGICQDLAALAACITQGRTLEERARLAIGAGALACTSEETIHPGMSWENINYILNKEDM